MLKVLKSIGVSFNVRFNDQLTPLHVAVSVQDRHILKYLLDKSGIKINVVDAKVSHRERERERERQGGDRKSVV